MAHGNTRVVALLALLLVAIASTAAASTADFAAREGLDTWRPAAGPPRDTTPIDHSPWAALLQRYLVTNHPSGVNRFDYAAVTAADRQRLDAYLSQLAHTDPRSHSRDEQMAYWINLYNAATVRVILDNPGVDSIRDIGGGWFSSGPWDQDDVVVGGQQLSLNDIEHQILRPFFGDRRVHYAVNCASIGCPNLAPEPYTGAQLEAQLTAGEHDYINHPRGLELDGSRLYASSIFNWYRKDFPAGEAALRAYWASKLDDADVATAVRQGKGRISYRYDWSLNAP